jgi:DDE superfamily endonuclease
LHTPIIVLKTATLLEKWIVNELADDTMLLYSESGYSNDDINLKWVKHFDRATQRKIQGVFRLLILDGFSSHIKYDFVKYAQHFKIILFGLPPHTTHFLQPLDMVCFQPLKHYHAEAIDTAVRTGDTTFSKIEFLTAFKEFRKQAFKQDTILSAFSKTGIIPHNPSKVLIPLQQRVDAHYRALNIEGHTTIIEERASRKKTTQKRVLERGIISVQEARMRVQERADDDASMEAKRAGKRQQSAKKPLNRTTADAAQRSKQSQL